MSSNSSLAAITAALDETDGFLRHANYRGYDPYDALQSPLFRLPLLRSNSGLRWAFQQSLKRLPINLRPLLRIRKGYNPVTIALVLQALTYRARVSTLAREALASQAPSLLSELGRLSTPGFTGRCWGYDFPWQARYATIPAWHPTIVATGFVTNALYEFFQTTASEEAKTLILESLPFVEHDLNRIEDDDALCWSYSPTDRQQVLNASMKGVRLCAQGFALSGRRDLADLAMRGATFVADHQRRDGSWPYSVSDARSWSDSFHTAYILDAFDSYVTITRDRTPVETLDRGVSYYLDRFFTSSGAPKYYDNRVFPIDATACGQSLLTLTRFGEVDRAMQLARWCLSHLRGKHGAWKYQVHRWWDNRLVYVRWSVVWMYAGLSMLESQLGDSHERIETAS
jgi:hypothetical protein